MRFPRGVLQTPQFCSEDRELHLKRFPYISAHYRSFTLFDSSNINISVILIIRNFKWRAYILRGRARLCTSLAGCTPELIEAYTRWPRSYSTVIVYRLVHECPRAREFYGLESDCENDICSGSWFASQQSARDGEITARKQLGNAKAEDRTMACMWIKRSLTLQW